MEEDVQELKEERGALVDELESLDEQLSECDDAEKREELQQEFDALDAEYEKLSDEIRRKERLAKRRAEREKPDEVPGDQPGGEGEERDIPDQVEDRTRALALQGWTRAQVGEHPTAEQREAAEACGVRLDSGFFDMRLINDYSRIEREYQRARDEGRNFECRVMGVNETETPAEGAELVPEGFSNELEDAMLSWGQFRQYATVRRTASGNDIPWPTSNDTNVKGEYVAEASDTSGTETDVTVGKVTLGAHKCSSKMVKLTNELLTDSAFNMARFVGNKVGERIGRISNEKFTNGSGTDLPYGIVTELAAGSSGSEYITTSSSTDVAPEDILDLIHAVDPAYRTAGTAFMMHDDILASLRKQQEDSKTLGVWGTNWLDERDGTWYLVGYPVCINQDMDNTITSGDNTVLFGQLGKYIIREVNSMRLRVLEERYAEFDEVAYIAFMRNDGHLLDAGTHPVVLLQQS